MSEPSKHDSPISEEIVRLEITEANHDDNAFWNLGPIVHEVPPAALFEHLPGGWCNDRSPDGTATCETACYIVDAIDASGDRVAEKEITREQAEKLLDEPIDVLRDRHRNLLWDLFGATG